MRPVTYVLHNRLGSGGFAVEAAMVAAGIPHRLELINSLPSTVLPGSFKSVNPWGQVPVLVTPQGETITETAAILIYLAQNHPELRDGPVLWVESEAAFLRWTVFMGVNLYEGVLRLVYPERYVSAVAGVEDDDPVHSALRRAARLRNAEAFRVLETEIQRQGHVVGGKLSAADIFFAMLYAWNRGTPDLPGCVALTHQVAGHPAIAETWQRNFGSRLGRDWSAAP